MSDNVLKKEFQKRDVQRLRNLVQGKYGSKTTMGIGYSGEAQEEHKEGDVWEQNGRTWTIKDGLKENVTKLDKFKNAAIPLFCPKCKQVMDKQLDPHYYKSYGTCLDCRTEFETKLKLEGKWDDYVTEAYNQEIDGYIEDYKAYMQDALAESNEGYVTEDGDIQKWVGGIDKDRVAQSMQESIEYLNSLKRKPNTNE
jgi:hypothetical protein